MASPGCTAGDTFALSKCPTSLNTQIVVGPGYPSHASSRLM